MRGLTWMLVLAVALLSGCQEAKPSEQEEDEEGAGGPLFTYKPINDQGTLDLVPPTVGPRDTSPVCRVLVAEEPFRVLNLTATLEWEPTSERTQELRFVLATGAETGPSVEGESPLNLTAQTFDVHVDDRFGIVVSLIGEEATDPLLDPQEVHFEQGFVAQYPPREDDMQLGIWSSDCP